MTASPIEMPASVPVLSLPPDVRPAWERNERLYRSTCSYHELPESTHIAVVATDASVLVTATDIDVLGMWLDVMGGWVEKAPLPWGQTVWTLHTETWSDSPRVPVVAVHVSVTLPTDAPVMHEIAEAVRRG